MPSGTSEARPVHERARQFFFVLEGEAVLEIDGLEHLLAARHGLEVAPGTAHQIFNRAATDLNFLVISLPPVMATGFWLPANKPLPPHPSRLCERWDAHYVFAQSCQTRFSTRANSETFAVTSVNLWRRACPAINRS